MFWLIAMLASVGAGAASVLVTLRRMGGNFEASFKAAPDLVESEFADDAYGKITGIVSTKTPHAAPGLGVPSALYELVVYRTYQDTHNTTDWRIVHRAQVGDELEVTVGHTVVRASARDIFVLVAPAHDANENLGPRGGFGNFRSRVRFIPDGAVVQIAGTLTREVDDDPTARRDYRETATRYRIVGTRKLPLVIACSAKQQKLLAPST